MELVKMLKAEVQLVENHFDPILGWPGVLLSQVCPTFAGLSCFLKICPALFFMPCAALLFVYLPCKVLLFVILIFLADFS
jgi:hypothetical protein